MNFLKTTAIGGLVFLVPLVVVVAILGKALGLMRDLVALIESRVPMITIGDLLVLNLIAVLVLFLVCFLAGLIARSPQGRRLGKRVESTLLATLPGYSVIAGFANSLRTSEEQSRDFVPVLAHFDDSSQLAFEVERTPKGKVVVYLPGAPDPWSGSVVYLTEDRVESVSMSVGDVVRCIRMLGRNSSGYAEKAV